MIPRHLKSLLAAAARQNPVTTLTGPRQSGKTTLARLVFPKLPYVSLEAPNQRDFARGDPLSFLRQFETGAVLDEIQRVPELFSYLQGRVDDDPGKARFVLTGSHNFLLMQQISQTLAGRCAVLHLLPFSLSELNRRKDLDAGALAGVPRHRKPVSGDLDEVLFRGFFPRIHDRKLPPQEWLAAYTQTYLERDVRSVLNVTDLGAFSTFLRLCAGRAGQLLSLTSLAADCGITHTTARRWLSLLEASFVVWLARPYHRNFSKRLVKAPKLHFFDSGLLCYLLRIRSPLDLATHPLRGAIFESFVASELYKSMVHRGQQPDLFFWRDSNGNEIDLIVESSSTMLPAVEIKSGRTIPADFARRLREWPSIAGGKPPLLLVHGGDESYVRENVTCLSWRLL